MHKLLREAKPNETKLNELKKQYIPPSNCESLSETRVNSNIWNNLGETARSNDLKLQKVQKYLIKGMTAVVTVIDSLIKDEPNSSKEDNIGKLMDAVILLANANTEVNLRRRERLKPELHPSYRHLCNPSNTITSQLFGDDLPKAVKDIAEANRISSKIHGDRRSADRRDKRQRSRHFAGSNSRTPYRSKFFLYIRAKKLPSPPFLEQERGGQEETATATGENPVKEPLSKSPPEKDQVSLTTFQATVIAGRTKYFIPAWQEITADKQILEMVQGCPFEFISMPKQLSSSYPFSHNPVEREIISKEVDRLLIKGVIEETTHLEGEFISSIFVRKKKDNTYRMILNLKDLNYNIEKKHFKMDTFLSAVNLVKQNCYMASVDLRDAYYTIPISIKYRKYLRFEWQGKLYQYTCLPNGLSSAPRSFTKILKPVYSSLRSKGHVNVGYIDDSYLQGDTYEECKHNVQDSVNLFEKLGFLPHPEKSVFEPTQITTFLGFVINSVTMTITLTSEKALKVSMACKKLLAKSECSIVEVSQVIGLLVASLPAVQYGQLHYRHLEIDKNIALKIAKGNYQDIMCLSPAAKADLGWWVDNVFQSNNPISHGKIDIEITCDASKKGWGAVCNKISTQGL